MKRTLLTAAILSVCTSTAQAVDIRLFPADTEVVITVNVKQALELKPDSVQEVLKHVGGALLRQATVNEYQKALHDRLPGYTQTMKLLDKMGFDPGADLYTISVAHPGSSRLNRMFVVAEGRFADDKFEAAARETRKELGEALQFSRIGKVAVCEIKINDPDDRVQAVWLAIVGGKSLVMSYELQAVKDAVARVEKNQFVAVKVEELLKRTHEKQTMSFVITRNAAARLVEEDKADIQFLPLPAAIVKDKRLGEFLHDFRKAWVENNWFQHLDSVCGAVTLARDISFELHFGGKDANAARELEGLMNLCRLLLNIVADSEARQNEERAFLRDITRSLRVTRTDNFAVLTGSVSYLNMGKLLALISPRSEEGARK